MSRTAADLMPMGRQIDTRGTRLVIGLAIAGLAPKGVQTVAVGATDTR